MGAQSGPKALGLWNMAPADQQQLYGAGTRSLCFDTRRHGQRTFGGFRSTIAPTSWRSWTSWCMDMQQRPGEAARTATFRLFIAARHANDMLRRRVFTTSAGPLRNRSRSSWVPASRSWCVGGSLAQGLGTHGAIASATPPSLLGHSATSVGPRSQQIRSGKIPKWAMLQKESLHADEAAEALAGMAERPAEHHESSVPRTQEHVQQPGSTQPGVSSNSTASFRGPERGCGPTAGSPDPCMRERTGGRDLGG